MLVIIVGASGLFYLEWVSLFKDTNVSKILLKVSRVLQHNLYQCAEITTTSFKFFESVANSVVRGERTKEPKNK
jgi:hypothetical protein